MDTGVLPFTTTKRLSPTLGCDTPIVPSPAFAGPMSTISVESNHNCHERVPARNTVATPLPCTTAEATFDKSALGGAKILGQVDLKYVACLLKSSLGGRSLVLVDQHAADERVSVEVILRNLCTGFARDTIDLTELTKFETKLVLSREEADVMARPEVLDTFRRWGMHLMVNLVGSDYEQVEVKAVPTALLSRLGRKEAIEMTRLIKTYLPVLDESLGELRALISEADRSEVDWGRILRWMPKEMLELANSKACRGTSTSLRCTVYKLMLLARCDHV